MSFGTTAGCVDDCSDSVMSAFGSQDAFCALDDVSCTDDCGAEWIAAHCACETGALFGSFSYEFIGSEDVCCGDASCQSSVVEMYVSLSDGSTYDEIEAMLMESCAGVSCGTKEYSQSYAQSWHATKSFSHAAKSFSLLAKSFSHAAKSFSQSFSGSHKMTSYSHSSAPAPAPVPTIAWMPESMAYSMSFGTTAGCVDDCSDSVMSAFGYQDAFCALDDVSCTDDCGAEWIAAHCACETGVLFGSFS